MELEFSFPSPFVLIICCSRSCGLLSAFPSAWLHSAGARPHPAGGGGERLPDAQALQDPEGEEAGGCHQGTTGYSSTYLLSGCLYLLFV